VSQKVKTWNLPVFSDRPGVILQMMDTREIIEAAISKIFSSEIAKNLTQVNISSTEEGFCIIAFFNADNEIELRNIEDAIKEILKNNDYTLSFLERYGDIYLPKDFPEIVVYKHNVALFIRKRLWTYVRKLQKILESGMYPIVRSLGEEFGREIALEYGEMVKDVLAKDEFERIVKLITKVMYYIGLYPPAVVQRDGREIVVKLLKDSFDEDMLKIIKHHFYGALVGVVNGLGFRAELKTVDGRTEYLRVWIRLNDYRIRIALE